MIFNETIIKLVVGLLSAAILAGAIWLGYDKVKQIGYKEAEVKYEQVIKDYENNINRKITAIEANSHLLVEESRENNTLLAKDMETLLVKVKGKTLTVVKNGECTPSQTFSDTFVEANKRANQAMKDTKK